MTSKKWSPNSSKENVPFWTSCRFALALVSFVGFINVYAIRINISVAMVCLAKPAVESPLNDTAINLNKTITGSAKCEAYSSTNKSKTAIIGPKVEWSKVTQGNVLSSFFYGYIITQIPGGWLSNRFGGKWVFGIGMGIACLMTLLTPVAIMNESQSPIPIIAVRVIMGLACGVVFPAMHAIWGKWAPPLERSKLMSICYAGTIVGNIVALSLSGYLCQQDFLQGWPSIFYIFGGVCFIWLCFWFYMVYDYPSYHPRISEEEILYIEDTVGDASVPLMKTKDGKEQQSVPWLSFLKSGPLWAILVAHICNNWGNYTLLTKLPTYMNDVLKYNIRDNGLYSSLPYMMMFIATIGIGQFADCLRVKKLLSTTAVRKMFQTFAFIGAAACMIGTSFVDCDIRMVAVVLLTIGTACTAGVRSGYQINHVDIAPRYAGELCGITNTIATIPGMVSPIIVSALTPKGIQEEWQTVFYMWGGIFVFGALFYLIFASGNEQSWAKLKHNEGEELQEKTNI